jgi:trehalose 6-phosphate synthase/phosphatase
LAQFLIVSNRLPVTARLEEDHVKVVRSIGGLATGLKGLHESSGSLWLGWPGDVEHFDEEQRADLAWHLAERRTVPLYLTREQIRAFYEGFSNGVLWPLFHYLIDKVRLDAGQDWEVYRAANERFAAAAARHLDPDGLVWVHDYQLCLVPQMLRERVPGARIGYFLHIPFPSPEVFRILPWRNELLRGLLGADLIGFHTHTYMKNFRASLRYVLGINVDFDRVRHAGRETRLGVFPMGIDASGFSAQSDSAEVQAEVASIRSEIGERKLVVAIDRLDYTKGIRRRLLAIEHLLERAPELRGAFRIVQVAVPSRTQVEQYKQFRRQIDEMVGRINGAYSTVDFVPIHYLYRSLPRQQLVALYRAADAMLVTPLRDGMNLVAKEFVASRTDEDGVLILSEFAGAAAELGESVLVNPYDIEGVATAIETALTMPPEERKTRMHALRKRVLTADVQFWARSFIDALQSAGSEHARSALAASSPAVLGELAGRLAAAERLLLLLDYDGTLVPFASTPNLAKPDRELLELLAALAARPGTAVHVVSGRNRETLDRWLGHLPLGLHAEHGVWSRPEPAGEWVPTESFSTDWKAQVLPVLEELTARTPGSLIEEKTASVAWHYRMVDPDFGLFQATELRRALDELLRDLPVEVLPGNRVLEVRLRGVHKGRIAEALLAEAQKPLLAFAMGDDRTDEDLFAALPEDGITAHVGPGQSRAAYRIADPEAARAFLRRLLR